jgi:ubiquinone/menaquinone biosynthesis C-methylase UbiE
MTTRRETMKAPLQDQTIPQEANVAWWESNPMIYDNWRGELKSVPGSKQWFHEIDARFFNPVASWFAQAPDEKPFSKLIPFDTLKGKRVLEVGCGSGAHARLLAESGCELTCVDITERAVETTQRRLSTFGLEANVLRMDAERLEFADESFDFVWSWGVVHHSSNTERVVGEIARVLRPGGQFRAMVYHRPSAFVTYATVAGALSGKLFRSGYDDVIASYSDGATARFYSKAEFQALLGRYFSEVETAVFGQKTELIPLPGSGLAGKLKRQLVASFPDRLGESLLERWGKFLFAVADKAKT